MCDKDYCDGFSVTELETACGKEHNTLYCYFIQYMKTRFCDLSVLAPSKLLYVEK